MQIQSEVLRARIALVVILLLVVAFHEAAQAQSPAASSAQAIGIEGIARIGLEWPTASKTFEALSLDEQPREIGGGVQITNLWRDLFAEVSVGHASMTGQRAFVDDDGTVFPLDVPLTVKSTQVEFSGGWRFAPGAGAFQSLSSYAGAGVGIAKLEERSPVAEPGEDVDESTTSYHVMGGMIFKIRRWLSVSGDLRYRWVPDLLGEGGVAGALGDDDFGGFHAGVGIRVGFAGRRGRRVSDTPVQELPPFGTPPVKTTEQVEPAPLSVILAAAPVYLKPDANREPLRTLEPGTTVKVLQEDGDWIRIEFRDRLLGPRIGYVQRQYIRIRN